MSTVYGLAKQREDEALAIADPYFNSRVSQEVRDKDMQYVQWAQNRFKDSAREKELASVAGAFEYVVYKRINETGWLGDSMCAQLTTPYDDYHQGIDLYAERADAPAGNPLGLSIDLTFSTHERDIQTKIAQIKDFQLDRGNLAHLRYYRPIQEAARESEHVPEVRLPKVIIGVNRNRALDSIKRYADNRPEERDVGTGLIMLYQMERQLSIYARYSRALYKTKKLDGLLAAADRYESTYKEIRALTDEKLASMQISREIMTTLALQDPVTQLIVAELDRMVEAVLG